MEQCFARTIKALVAKLDEDDVSAPIAVQLLLAAALPLSRAYTSSGKAQQACSLLLHSTVLMPFLPLSAAAALLRLAHNTCEQQGSTLGPSLEYDRAVLATALKVGCGVLMPDPLGAAAASCQSEVDASTVARSPQRSAEMILADSVAVGPFAATASSRDAPPQIPACFTPRGRNAFDGDRSSIGLPDAQESDRSSRPPERPQLSLPYDAMDAATPLLFGPWAGRNPQQPPAGAPVLSVDTTFTAAGAMGPPAAAPTAAAATAGAPQPEAAQRLVPCDHASQALVRIRSRSRTQMAPMVADVNSSALFSPSSKYVAGPGKAAPDSRIPVLFGRNRKSLDPAGARRGAAGAGRLKRHSGRGQKGATQPWPAMADVPLTNLCDPDCAMPKLYGRQPLQPGAPKAVPDFNSPAFDASAAFSRNRDRFMSGHAGALVAAGCTPASATVPPQPHQQCVYVAAAAASPEVNPLLAAAAEIAFARPNARASTVGSPTITAFPRSRASDSPLQPAATLADRRARYADAAAAAQTRPPRLSGGSTTTHGTNHTRVAAVAGLPRPAAAVDDVPLCMLGSQATSAAEGQGTRRAGPQGAGHRDCCVQRVAEHGQGLQSVPAVAARPVTPPPRAGPAEVSGPALRFATLRHAALSEADAHAVTEQCAVTPPAIGALQSHGASLPGSQPVSASPPLAGPVPDVSPELMPPGPAQECTSGRQSTTKPIKAVRRGSRVGRSGKHAAFRPSAALGAPEQLKSCGDTQASGHQPNTLSHWQLFLAACMLRCQREAAADFTTATPASAPTAAAAPALPSMPARSAGSDPVPLPWRRMRARMERAFSVPAHATIEHIHWLEIARTRYKSGQPIIPADARAATCGTGSSESPRIKASHSVTHAQPGLTSGDAGIHADSSGTLKTWHSSSARAEGAVSRDEHKEHGTAGAAGAAPPGSRVADGGLSSANTAPLRVCARQAWDGNGPDGAGGGGRNVKLLNRGAIDGQDEVGLHNGSRQAVSTSEQLARMPQVGARSVEEEVGESLVLLRELEAVCGCSGYECAAWVRRVLEVQAADNGAPDWRSWLPVQCSVCTRDLALDRPSAPGDELVILECNHSVHARCLGTGKSGTVFRCPDCGEDSPMVSAVK
eukprot:jgi/Ulvmu1/1675/UM115_0004.1